MSTKNSALALRQRQAVEAAQPTPAGADSSCVRCGAAFTCGAQAGQERCWCMEFPPIGPSMVTTEPDLNGCYCPACLKIVSQERP